VGGEGGGQGGGPGGGGCYNIGHSWADKVVEILVGDGKGKVEEDDITLYVPSRAQAH